jgi:hypothetical protein
MIVLYIKHPYIREAVPRMATARWHCSENKCEVSTYQGANTIPRINGRGAGNEVFGLNVVYHV